jgi:hypothetical protein
MALQRTRAYPNRSTDGPQKGAMSNLNADECAQIFYYVLSRPRTIYPHLPIGGVDEQFVGVTCELVNITNNILFYYFLCIKLQKPLVGRQVISGLRTKTTEVWPNRS